MANLLRKAHLAVLQNCGHLLVGALVGSARAIPRDAQT